MAEDSSCKKGRATGGAHNANGVRRWCLHVQLSAGRSCANTHGARKTVIDGECIDCGELSITGISGRSVKFQGDVATVSTPSEAGSSGHSRDGTGARKRLTGRKGENSLAIAAPLHCQPANTAGRANDRSQSPRRSLPCSWPRRLSFPLKSLIYCVFGSAVEGRRNEAVGLRRLPGSRRCGSTTLLTSAAPEDSPCL